MNFNGGAKLDRLNGRGHFKNRDRILREIVRHRDFIKIDKDLIARGGTIDSNANISGKLQARKSRLNEDILIRCLRLGNISIPCMTAVTGNRQRPRDILRFTSFRHRVIQGNFRKTVRLIEIHVEAAFQTPCTNRLACNHTVAFNRCLHGQIRDNPGTAIRMNGFEFLGIVFARSAVEGLKEIGLGIDFDQTGRFVRAILVGNAKSKFNRAHRGIACGRLIIKGTVCIHAIFARNGRDRRHMGRHLIAIGFPDIQRPPETLSFMARTAFNGPNRWRRRNHVTDNVNHTMHGKIFRRFPIERLDIPCPARIGRSPKHKSKSHVGARANNGKRGKVEGSRRAIVSSPVDIGPYIGIRTVLVLNRILPTSCCRARF